MNDLPEEDAVVDDDSTGIFELEHVPSPRPDTEDHSRIIAGRYEIAELIGEGGMGQVLKVRHRRLGKAFALKLMRPEFSVDATARQIFDREARLASALSHPNIVSIVDFGEDPDWGLFIVMEYIDGEVLVNRISAGTRIEVATACDVAKQLADAIAHSHKHKVVHGDLKSENVLCVDDERRHWQAKLLDFGTAQVEKVLPRHDDTIAGTPEYLAPERITGASPQPSNDIYALGVILYEMLCGTPPFRHDVPAEVLRMHLTATLPPIEEVRGEAIDDALIAIVHRALARDPQDRYQSATTLSGDLQQYMQELGLRVRHQGGRTDAEPRIAAAADAFQSLGVAACSIDSDGTIVAANSKFAKLWGYQGTSELEGASVLATPLAKLHRGLRDDVRVVAMDGKVVRRRVQVRRKDKPTVVFRLLLTPSSGYFASCTMLLHPLAARRTPA